MSRRRKISLRSYPGRCAGKSGRENCRSRSRMLAGCRALLAHRAYADLEVFSSEPTWLTRDAAFMTQFAALRQLALVNRAPGADLREAAYAIATHAFLRRWLELSDALVDELDGSRRLKARRRKGILRHLDGPLRGMPFFEPPVSLYVSDRSPEPRIFPAWDELEFVVLLGHSDEHGWRPTKQTLNFDEARAWAEMKAATLYARTAKRDIPGQTWRPLGGDPDVNLREIRFDVELFRRWAVMSEVQRPPSRRRSSRRRRG